MCGAFDNYYNHTTSTGTFVVQSLCCANEDSKYTRLGGSTSGSSITATKVAQFKSYINAYEGYIIQDMESPNWPVVAGWALVIASFTTLLIGFGTGPVGWAAVAL